MEHNPDAPWYRRLHWQVLIAMALGALVGAVFGEPMADRVGWIGDLFMKLLRMITVPLAVTSIISGVASVGGGRALGRLFSKTLGYYVLSSFLAALVGLLMVNLIRPGVGANLTATDQQALPELSTPDSPIQLLLDIVPQNVIEAAAGADMLALIFFCIVFGAALTTLPDRTREPLVQLIDALFHAMMNLTSGISKFLPIRVFALITRMVGTTGFDAFRPLAMYALTIFSGVTFHFFVSLPILLLELGVCAAEAQAAGQDGSGVCGDVADWGHDGLGRGVADESGWLGGRREGRAGVPRSFHRRDGVGHGALRRPGGCAAA